MSIFGANLSWKLSFQLQTRIFTFRRVYCSSVPVRYIPNKKRDPKACPPVGTSSKEKIAIHRRLKENLKPCGDGGHTTSVSDNKSWRNLCENQNEEFMNDCMDKEDKELESGEDDSHGFEDYDFEEENKHVEEDNSGSQTIVLQAPKTKQEAESAAIQLLARRAFTAVELRKKLSGKKFPFDIIEGVIDDFKGRGLINDCLLAEGYSRSKWSSSSWGPRRIKQALSRKGVSEVDVEKAVKLVFKEGTQSGDQELICGLSKQALDHLIVQASKQWLRGADVSQETQKSRIIRWLQYRGFNWDVINYTLRILESQSSR